MRDDNLSSQYITHNVFEVTRWCFAVRILLHFKNIGNPLQGCLATRLPLHAAYDNDRLTEIGQGLPTLIAVI